MTTPHTRHLVQKLVETDEKVKVLVHELYVVTGASRGIGRAVALALAKKHVNLDFLLIARSENALGNFLSRFGVLNGSHSGRGNQERHNTSFVKRHLCCHRFN